MPRSLILKIRKILRSPRTLRLQAPLRYIMGRGNGDKGDRRGRGQGQGQSQPREMQISKALSLLLRHAAEKEGLKMNAQGYANVADVV